MHADFLAQGGYYSNLWANSTAERRSVPSEIADRLRLGPPIT